MCSFLHSSEKKLWSSHSTWKTIWEELIVAVHWMSIILSFYFCPRYQACTGITEQQLDLDFPESRAVETMYSLLKPPIESIITSTNDWVPSILWIGFIWSVKSLNGTRSLTCLSPERIPQHPASDLSLKHQLLPVLQWETPVWHGHEPFWVIILLVYPVNMRFAHLHNHVS